MSFHLYINGYRTMFCNNDTKVTYWVVLDSMSMYVSVMKNVVYSILFQVTPNT